MADTSRTSGKGRRHAFPALLLVFVALSLALTYAVAVDGMGSPPEQGIAGPVQSPPVFPTWFLYSLLGAWSVSLVAIVALYVWSKKPRLSGNFPQS